MAASAANGATRQTTVLRGRGFDLPPPLPGLPPAAHPRLLHHLVGLSPVALPGGEAGPTSRRHCRRDRLPPCRCGRVYARGPTGATGAELRRKRPHHLRHLRTSCSHESPPGERDRHFSTHGSPCRASATDPVSLTFRRPAPGQATRGRGRPRSAGSCRDAAQAIHPKEISRPVRQPAWCLDTMSGQNLDEHRGQWLNASTPAGRLSPPPRSNKTTIKRGRGLDPPPSLGLPPVARPRLSRHPVGLSPVALPGGEAGPLALLCLTPQLWIDSGTRSRR